MIIDPDFLDHWKTQLLVDLLGDELAPLYLIRLWGHCQQRKKTEFELGAPALKAICRFGGDANALLEAMTESGWVTHDGTVLLVTGWDERNAKLIANWGNGHKGGRKPKRNPPGTQPEPTGNPTQVSVNPQGTDKIRVDKSREEKKQNRELERIEHDELREAVADWIEYKSEKRQPYKPRGLKALVSTVLSRSLAFGVDGESKAIHAIRSSMGDNYQGIIWDRYTSTRGSPRSNNDDAADEFMRRIGATQ